MTKAFKENDMQDQIVKAEFFLPMRGHVADGTRVLFQSGEELTVRNSMRGWKLVNEKSGTCLGPFDGALELTSAIVRYDATSSCACA